MCDYHYRAELRSRRPHCSVDGCERQSDKRRLCTRHYRIWREFGTTDEPPPKPRPSKPKCSIDDCDRDAHCRGWCALHYSRWRMHGDPLKVIVRRRAARLSPADIDSEAKVCSTCKRRLPLEAFYKRSKAPDGLMYRCKDCCRDAFNNKYRDDPNFREQRRRYQRSQAEARSARRNRARLRGLARYGLTAEEFDSLADEQGGVCAICGCPPYGGRPDARKTRLSVDHDHLTRRVRGLLCDPCNTGLGMFKDDPARLRAAIDYLVRTRTQDASG